jgi:D-sedoheptulose 7-phosphate isomerase
MFIELLQRHKECFDQLPALADAAAGVGEALARVLADGGKILVCGNGGSAADAQHFAAEIIGRFEQERPSWPAVALTTDSSILTALGNDYGFDEIFARQVQGLGKATDALVAISTSGSSENVLRAVDCARALGMTTVGLLGRDGGAIKGRVDFAIVIDDRSTARIQEAHIFILHFWAMAIERHMAAGS